MKKFTTAILAGVAMSLTLASVAAGEGQGHRRFVVELPGRALEDRRSRDEEGHRGRRTDSKRFPEPGVAEPRTPSLMIPEIDAISPAITNPENLIDPTLKPLRRATSRD